MKHSFLKLPLAIIAALTAGCSSKYLSSYSASLLVRNNTSTHASASFHALRGTLVFNLKVSKNTQVLDYTGSLTSGSATVYYDNDGTKLELFTIDPDTTIKSTLEPLKVGKLYIIIQTSKECIDGSFTFTIK